MGCLLKISQQMGEEEVEFRFTRMDENLLIAARTLPIYRNDLILLNMLWSQSSTGSAKREDFRQELILLLKEFDSPKKPIFYSYYHTWEATDSLGNSWLFESSPHSSGHRIADDPLHYYSIECGVGICDLKKWAVDPSGQEIMVATLDVRSQRTIETANNGTIKITKRKQKNTLQPLLRKLLEFADSCSSEVLYFTSISLWR